MAATNKQLLIKGHPEGLMSESDFEQVETPLPELQDGQVLVRNILASIDPTHRIWASQGPQYMERLGLGSPMRAMTTGVVVESKHADYAKGDFVGGSGAIQQYYIGKPGVSITHKIEPKPESIEDVARHMSVLSMIIGIPAFVGVKKILQPDDKSIFLVSAGAGAVGSLAGQIAKECGATVIGVAGSEEKCKWMSESLKFDHALNYKTDDLVAKFKEIAPNGITHYFDNTAGPITEAFMQCSAVGGKICVCGAIADYNESEPRGIRSWAMIIVHRLKVQGVLVSDNLDSAPEFLEYAIPRVKSGAIQYKVDVRDGGLDKYVETVNELFCGGNKGKLLLKLGDM